MSALYSEYTLKAGRLDVAAPQTRVGKRVFEWEFEAAGAEGKKTAIEIRLKNGKDGELVFEASCERLPQPLLDTDIERLRHAVEQALCEQAALMTGIHWEDWLEVVVNGSTEGLSDSRRSIWKSDLKIQVKRLKRGVHPETGKALTISSRGFVVPFPSARSMNLEAEEVDSSLGKLKLGPDPFEASYIQATPENEAALQDIMGRMEALRERLAHLLSQDKIQQVLDAPGNHLPLLESKEKKS